MQRRMLNKTPTIQIVKQVSLQRGQQLANWDFPAEIIKFSNRLMYGARIMSPSAVNNCCYGKFPICMVGIG